MRESNEASSCRVVRYSKGQEKPVRVRFFEDGHFCWIVEDWITESDSELGELCKARKAVIKAREAEAERKRKAEWEEKKHWWLSWLSYVCCRSSTKKYTFYNKKFLKRFGRPPPPALPEIHSEDRSNDGRTRQTFHTGQTSRCPDFDRPNRPDPYNAELANKPGTPSTSSADAPEPRDSTATTPAPATSDSGASETKQPEEEGFLAKAKAKWAAFSGKTKKIMLLLPLLLFGWLAWFFSRNRKSGLEVLVSGIDWMSPKTICGGLAVLIVCFFGKRMCCTPKDHVWSDNYKSYVPRKSPLALTDTEGGIGLGGWFLILLIIGGIYCYFAMKPDTSRGPLIPLYGPGRRPPARQWPPPRRPNIKVECSTPCIRVYAYT